MTQSEAAALFGVPQPRISDLVHARLNLFWLGTLMDMAATAGMAPVVKVARPSLDPPASAVPPGRGILLEP